MEIAGQDAELPEIRRRARYLALFVVVAFVGIAGRLFYLQVIEGDAFFRITSDSIIRTESLPAVRGQIRDRKGKVMATVRPSYNVYGTPGVVKPDVFARLRALLGMNGDQAMDVWERLAAPQANPRAPAPVLIAEDISREAMASIETGVDLPGVKIVSAPRRSYPFGTMAAHVARLHERDLGGRAAGQEGRGLSSGRSRSAAPASSGNGTATCAAIRGFTRSSSIAAGCPRPTSETSSRVRAPRPRCPATTWC